MNNILVSEETLQTVLDLVVRLTQRTIPVADGVSVTLVVGQRAETIVHSEDVALPLDDAQYEANSGPCISAFNDGSIVSSANLSGDDRWPLVAAAARDAGVNSVLSIPFVPAGRAIGALNIYSREPTAFGEDAVAVATMFARQAAVVVANSHSYAAAGTQNEQLREALESRDVIGQAKGILIAREKITSDEAFERLMQLSQRSNRKLRDLAAEIVANAQEA